MQIAFEGFSVQQMLSGDTFASGCCTFLPGYLNFLKSKTGRLRALRMEEACSGLLSELVDCRVEKPQRLAQKNYKKLDS